MNQEGHGDNGSFNSEHFERGKDVLERLTKSAIGKLQRFRSSHAVPIAFAYYCYPCLFSTKRRKKWKSHMNNGVHVVNARKFGNCQTYECDCLILIFSDNTFYESHLNSSFHNVLKTLCHEKLQDISIKEDANKENTEVLEYPVVSSKVAHDATNLTNSGQLRNNKHHSRNGKTVNVRKKIVNPLECTNLPIHFTKLCKRLEEDTVAALIKNTFYCHPCQKFMINKYHLWKGHLTSKNHIQKCTNGCVERLCDCRIIIFCDVESYDKHKCSQFHQDLITEISKYPIASRILLANDSKPEDFLERYKALNYLIQMTNMALRHSTISLNENTFALGFYCYPCSYRANNEMSWIKHFLNRRHTFQTTTFPDCFAFRCSCQLLIYGDQAICARHLHSDPHAKLISLMSRREPDFKRCCEILNSPLRELQCDKSYPKLQGLSHLSISSKKLNDPVQRSVPRDSYIRLDSKHFNTGCTKLDAWIHFIGSMIKRNRWVLNKNGIAFFCYPCLQKIENEKAWNKHLQNVEHVTRISKLLNFQPILCTCGLLIYGDEYFFDDHSNSSAHWRLLSILADCEEDRKQICPTTDRIIGNEALNRDMPYTENNSPDRTINKDKEISKLMILNESSTFKKLFNQFCRELRKDPIATVIQTTFWYYCYPCGHRIISKEKWINHLGTSMHRTKCMNMCCEEHHCDCQIVFFCDVESYDKHLHSNIHKDLITELMKYLIPSCVLSIRDSYIPINSKQFIKGSQLLNNLTYDTALLNEDILTSNANVLTLGFFCYPCLSTGTHAEDWEKHFEHSSHTMRADTFSNCFALLCSCKILIYGDRKLIATHLHLKPHSNLILTLKRYQSRFKGRCEIIPLPSIYNPVTKIDSKRSTEELTELKSVIAHQLFRSPARKVPNRCFDESIERRIQRSKRCRPEKLVGTSAIVSHHMENYHRRPDIMSSGLRRNRKEECLKFNGCRSNHFYLEHDVINQRIPHVKLCSKEDESKMKRRYPGTTYDVDE